MCFIYKIVGQTWVCVRLYDSGLTNVLGGLLNRSVIQQFLDQIHMTEEHSAATIPFQAQSIESVTSKIDNESKMLTTMDKLKQIVYTHPSVYSACKRLRYGSHLLPITLPQVKHRIGMIILVGKWCERNQISKKNHQSFRLQHMSEAIEREESESKTCLWCLS